MARLFVEDAEVRLLVAVMERMRAGKSVNQFCKELNQALGRRAIWPNRLHALLKSRPHSAINQRTADLLAEALTNLMKEGE